MSKLAWDTPGDRIFETGISNGVLYQEDGSGISWNGLTSIDDDVNDTSEPVYFDGTKFADLITFGEFSASLRAFTYPDEFQEYEGIQEDSPGFSLFNQRYKRFGLSYKTAVGDAVDGAERGYKIHLLWNLLAVPSQRSYKTLSLEVDPVEFEWKITAVPESIVGYRPTAHVVIDSTKINPYLLNDLEEILYGQTQGSLSIVDNGDGTWTASSSDDGVVVDNGDGSFSITTDSAHYLNSTTYVIKPSAHDAYLPSLNALISFVRNWAPLIITDHGDGRWSAYSTVPGVIVKLNATTFQITTDTAEYLDAETYTISSSDPIEGDVWLPR